MRKALVLILFLSLSFFISAGGDPTIQPYVTGRRELVFVKYFGHFKDSMAKGDMLFPISWLNGGLFAYVKVRYKNATPHFAETSYCTIIKDLRENKIIWSSGWSEYYDDYLPQRNLKPYYKEQWVKALPILQKYHLENSDNLKKVEAVLTENVNYKPVPAFIDSTIIYPVDEQYEKSLSLTKEPTYTLYYLKSEKGEIEIYLKDNQLKQNLLILTVKDKVLSHDGSLEPIAGYFYNPYEDSYVILVRNYDEDFIQVKIEKESTQTSTTTYLTPTVNNLRFRATPTLDGPFIRHLKAGERLELIEKGKNETIGDAKGTWVKVKTAQGEVGWCFDAYLQEVK